MRAGSFAELLHHLGRPLKPLKEHFRVLPIRATFPAPHFINILPLQCTKNQKPREGHDINAYQTQINKKAPFQHSWKEAIPKTDLSFMYLKMVCGEIL